MVDNNNLLFVKKKNDLLFVLINELYLSCVVRPRNCNVIFVQTTDPYCNLYDNCREILTGHARIITHFFPSAFCFLFILIYFFLYICVFVFPGSKEYWARAPTY